MEARGEDTSGGNCGEEARKEGGKGGAQPAVQVSGDAIQAGGAARLGAPQRPQHLRRGESGAAQGSSQLRAEPPAAAQRSKHLRLRSRRDRRLSRHSRPATGGHLGRSRTRVQRAARAPQRCHRRHRLRRAELAGERRPRPLAGVQPGEAAQLRSRSSARRMGSSAPLAMCSHQMRQGSILAGLPPTSNGIKRYPVSRGQRNCVSLSLYFHVLTRSSQAVASCLRLF